MLWSGLHHLGLWEYHNIFSARDFACLQIFENVYKTRNTIMQKTINASYVNFETKTSDSENMIITIFM